MRQAASKVSAPTHTMNSTTKNLLVAAWLSTVAALACAQTPDADVAAPAEAASSPLHVKAKHRKPMHVESTQPKPKKRHPKKANAPAPAPAPAASAAE
jgi:hypothetical protein